MVVRIDDVQIAAAIDGQAMRSLELTRSSPLRPTNSPEEFAVFGKLLHQSANGCDPNPILLIDANAYRPVNACLKGCELPAEAAEPVLIVSPGQQELAGC